MADELPPWPVRVARMNDQAARDLFAAHAVAALIVRDDDSFHHFGRAASHAYDLADAMMAERASRYGTKVRTTGQADAGDSAGEGDAEEEPSHANQS